MNEKTIKIGSVTVTIQRPILTSEQRKAAENKIIEALITYGKAIPEKYTQPIAQS